MVDPLALAIPFTIAAATAGLCVALLARWIGQAAVELAMPLGIVAGFIAGRSLQALAAGGAGPAGWTEIAVEVSGQIRELASPRSATSWPPLVAGGLGLVAVLATCPRQRATKVSLWCLQGLLLAAMMWWQFRTTRHVLAPSPESHARLWQAAILLAVGWLAITGPKACARSNGGPAPHWTLSLMAICGVALALLHVLSGSISLAIESLVVPAAACGLLLGIPLQGGEARASFEPPFATWGAVSLSYLLLGNLLATLTVSSGCLWLTAAACVAFGHVYKSPGKSRWIGLTFSTIAVVLLFFATWRAYGQFALDTLR